MEFAVSQSTGEIFRAHGLRRTRQREVLFEALKGTRSHPTAEELHKMVAPGEAGLSLATVYNALETFERVGLCRTIAVGGARRYDADVAAHAHIVTDGGRVLDVPEELGTLIMESIDPALVARIEREMGVRVDRVAVQLHGRQVPDG